MVRFGATIAISPRVGEVRLDEVVHQVGDAHEFTVRVLDVAGVEREVHLTFTEKWAATSWRRELQCHRCSGPARVLQLVQGSALCRRCSPYMTNHHRRKNSAAWKTEGALADHLVRSLMNSPARTTSPGGPRRLALRLKQNTLARAARVLGDAQHLIKVVDSLAGDFNG